jgi:hypothetical protein
MAEGMKKTEHTRLEDFIAVSRDGMRVDLEITLRKEMVSQKVHPEETETMKSEMDMCLLIGDYNFRVEDVVIKVSKVYMYGSTEGSREAALVDRNIANARLKMDYKRLKEANIEFEEKYF